MLLHCPSDSPLLCACCLKASIRCCMSSSLIIMHRDMRISNIMEHRTDGEPYLPSGFSSGKKTFHLPGMTWACLHACILDHGSHPSCMLPKLSTPALGHAGDKRPKGMKFAIIDNGEPACSWCCAGGPLSCCPHQYCCNL